MKKYTNISKMWKMKTGLKKNRQNSIHFITKKLKRSVDIAVAVW
jgi:hypothetical protein